MSDKIFVVPSTIWGKSRKLLLRKLDSYHDRDNPKITLNFCRDHYTTGRVVLNGIISHVSDKIRMNKLLDEYHIAHPKTYYYPFNNIPNNGECVLKKRHSSMGKNIIFTNFNNISSGVLGGDDYIQEYIPFERE